MAEAKKCKVDGCKRPYGAKGYCVTHYKKWCAGKMPKPRFRRCSETECKKKEFGRGLCEDHYYAKFGGKKPEAEQPQA